MKIFRLFAFVTFLGVMYSQQIHDVVVDSGWISPLNIDIPKSLPECPTDDDVIGCAIYLNLPQQPVELETFRLENAEANNSRLIIHKESYYIVRLCAYYYKTHLYAYSYIFQRPVHMDALAYISDQYHVFIDEDGSGKFTLRSTIQIGKTPYPPKYLLKNMANRDHIRFKTFGFQKEIPKK